MLGGEPWVPRGFRVPHAWFGGTKRGCEALLGGRRGGLGRVKRSGALRIPTTLTKHVTAAPAPCWAALAEKAPQ